MEFQGLETEQLHLRPFLETDASDIFRLSQEKSLSTWIPDQVYEDEAEAGDVISFLRSQYAPSQNPYKKPFVLAIALRATGEVIGHVGLSPLNDSEVEIGYAIGENYQKRGYASQAVLTLSQWAITKLGLPKINAIVASENIGSRRVLEKAGFILQEEREHFYLGKVRPCKMFAFSHTACVD